MGSPCLPEEERIKIRTVPALLVMPGCRPLTLENYSKITAGMRDSCFIDPIMSSLPAHGGDRDEALRGGWCSTSCLFNSR